MTRDLAYYRRQPYRRIWETREEIGERYFIVRIAEFPRIAGDGVTRAEALGHLRDAFDDFIAWRLEDGLEIPDPFRGVSQNDPHALELTWLDPRWSAAEQEAAPQPVACWDLKDPAAEKTCAASAAESPPRMAERVDVGALSRVA